MFKKDYIMRQYEEFGRVLGVILGLKKQNDWQKIEKEIYDATGKFVSLDINYIEDLNESDFEKEILNHPSLTQDQFKMLADLLFEKLDLYAHTNNEQKYKALKEKCMKLYAHIQINLTENEFDMNVHYKLKILQNKH